MIRSATPQMAGVAALVLATAVCFWCLVRHPGDLLSGPQRGGINDLTESIYPVRSWLAASIRDHGQLPFWNPYELSGAPWLGNPQTALFYPPNWLFLISREPWMASWILVLHHLWGGLGMWVLMRRYGFSNAAAALSGVAFLAAPYIVANTGEGHYNPVCLIAWMPWAFLCYEGLRGGNLRSAAWMSAVLAMAFFCGHVQELLYIGFVLTAFVVTDVIQRRGTRGKEPGSRRLLGGYAFAGMLSLGMVAVDLLAIWTYTRHSVRRGGLGAADVGSMIDRSSLYQLLDPLALGGPADYAGPGVCYWEAVCSFGVIVTLLAVLALLISRRRYPVGRMAVLAVVAVLFAFGTNAPLFPWMHAWVPGVGLFRAPARALFHASFAMAILAGAGLDGLLQLATGSATRQVRWMAAALAVLVSGGLGTTLWMRAVVPKPPKTAAPFQYQNDYHIGIRGALSESPAARTLGNPQLWICLLGAAGAAVAMSVRPRLGAWLAVGLVMAELAIHSHAVLRTIPPNGFRLDSPVVALLKAKAGGFRVAVPQSLLSDREAWRHGLRKIHGYEPVPINRYLSVIDALTKKRDAAMESGGFASVSPDDYEDRIADLLGIKYAVIETRKPSKSLGGWKLVATGAVPSAVRLRGNRLRSLPVSVYENPDPLPRAFVIGPAHVAAPGSVPAEVLLGTDPRRQALVEHDLLKAEARSEFRPATLVKDSPGELVLAAKLDAPGYLIVADTWYPGWRATVNGASAPVIPAFIGLRAVPLPAGNHTVRMTFHPPGLFLGGPISLIAWITFVLVVASGLRPSCGPMDRSGAEERESSGAALEATRGPGQALEACHAHA